MRRDESEAPASIRGQWLWNRIWPDVVRHICVTWRYHERHFDAAFQDSVNLAASVADMLAGLLVGVPPAVVSVLATRRGLAAICDVGRQFSSHQDYLCHLVETRHGLLFRGAILDLQSELLDESSCTRLLAFVATERQKATRPTQEAQLFSFAFRSARDDSAHAECSSVDLARILVSLLSTDAKHDALRWIVTLLAAGAPIKQDTEVPLVRCGAWAGDTLNEAVHSLLADWERHRIAIGFLCRVLGEIGNVSSLPVLSKALQRHQVELTEWGWSMSEKDPWQIAHHKVADVARKAADAAKTR